MFIIEFVLCLFCLQNFTTVYINSTGWTAVVNPLPMYGWKSVNKQNLPVKWSDNLICPCLRILTLLCFSRIIYLNLYWVLRRQNLLGVWSFLRKIKIHYYVPSINIIRQNNILFTWKNHNLPARDGYWWNKLFTL